MPLLLDMAHGDSQLTHCKIPALSGRCCAEQARAKRSRCLSFCWRRIRRAPATAFARLTAFIDKTRESFPLHQMCHPDLPLYPLNPAKLVRLLKSASQNSIPGGTLLMRKRLPLAFAFIALVFLAFATFSFATVFGNVRGIVLDPQHKPIAGATVQVKAVGSDFQQSAQTDVDGSFSFPAVPFGDYAVSVSASGFGTKEQRVTLASDTSSVLHFELALATVSETAVVTANAGTSELQTVTPTSLVNGGDIERTPGADLTNSLAMITDFTPGAYMTHDMCCTCGVGTRLPG